MLPQHVAIIPDGNRRWEKSRNLWSGRGHEEGKERFKQIRNHARALGIPFLTIWAFSTENWKRSTVEVGFIMRLLRDTLAEVECDMHAEKTRFVAIGRRDRLDKSIVQMIEKIEAETIGYTKFCVCVAIDYGGVDEACRAAERLRESRQSEKSLVDFLDTRLSGLPDPELIIRTGREHRMSGFMSLQSEYAEWVFPDVLFPDFGPVQFDEVLGEFAHRKRNFGK